MLDKQPFVISHNVRGLNTPEKQTSLLTELHKVKPSMAFLQEIHFKTGNVPSMLDKHCPHAYHATNSTSKFKGVSILCHKNVGFDISKQHAGADGRFIFLKGQ